MHDALSIAEILHIVFSFCDHPTNASTAVVCKQWSEESLNILWHGVNDLEILLRLLGELYLDDAGSYHFRDRITNAAWLRFQNIYQRRIRVLAVCDSGLFHHPLGSLGRIRTSGPLLPNLRAIRWDVSSDDDARAETYGEMFMDESVQTFILGSYGVSGNPIRNFDSLFSSISTRMPHLRSLQLFLHPCPEYRLPLINLVQSLPKLTALVIPPFPDMSIILIGISNLDSSLSHLEVFTRSKDLHPDPITTINLTGALMGDGLKNLTFLELYSSYSAALQIFPESRNLKEIQITSYEPASSIDTRQLLSQIAKNCAQVEAITLNFTNATMEVINRFKASPDIVTLDDLRPLLSCTQLVHISLETVYPLSLDDADIELIAKSWRSLEILYLAPVPGIQAADNLKTLSFRSLLHLALHCPQLRVICLYLDAEHIPEGLEGLDTTTVTQISEFSVGFSPINDPAQVAKVLASLLPPKVDVSWGPSSGGSFQWENVNVISPSINTTWDQHWKAVATFLPVMAQMRIDLMR